jgi:hypothetical protein
MDEAKAMGIEASRVLVTTDETDEAYLCVTSAWTGHIPVVACRLKRECELMLCRAPFRQMGWTFADHAKTKTGERLGYW